MANGIDYKAQGKALIENIKKMYGLDQRVIGSGAEYSAAFVCSAKIALSGV